MPKPPPIETMAEQWAEFALTILTPIELAPGDTQYIETRRAFYQGANAMLDMVKQISDRYPEAEACAKLDAIALEFHRFEQDLRNGRA